MLLAALATGKPPTWAMRGLTPAGALLAAALLMDLFNGPRDRLLLPLCGLLCALSLIFLTRIDPELATRQLVAMIVGICLMVALYFAIEDVRWLARLKYAAGAGAIGLLAITVLWGKEIGGARLWLTIPHLVTFQSGEVAKILMSISLAGYVAAHSSRGRAAIARRSGHIRSLGHLAPLLLIVALCLAIFVGQWDLGEALLFFGLFVVIFYLATGHRGYTLGAVALFTGGLVGACYLFPYAAARVTSWLNPWADQTGVGYQPLPAMSCLAKGGIFGAGLGQLSVAKLPAAATDLILAVIGQDLGLVGAVSVVMIYAFICVRSFSLAWQATDRFGALLAAALATVFSLQALIIMGGLLRIVPLTGMTTPFLSYGGSSVVVNFVALGLLLAVSRDCVPTPEALH